MKTLNSSYLNAIAQLAIVKKGRPRRPFIKHKPRLRMNINRKIRRIRVLQTPTSKHHKTFESLTFLKLSRENSKIDRRKPRRNFPTENQAADSDARGKEKQSSDCLHKRSRDKTEAPGAGKRSRRLRNWTVGGEEPEHRGKQRQGLQASIRTTTRDGWRMTAPSSSWLVSGLKFFL